MARLAGARSMGQTKPGVLQHVRLKQLWRPGAGFVLGF